MMKKIMDVTKEEKLMPGCANVACPKIGWEGASRCQSWAREFEVSHSVSECLELGHLVKAFRLFGRRVGY